MAPRIDVLLGPFQIPLPPGQMGVTHPYPSRKHRITHLNLCSLPLQLQVILILIIAVVTATAQHAAAAAPGAAQDRAAAAATTTAALGVGRGFVGHDADDAVVVGDGSNAPDAWTGSTIALHARTAMDST